MLLYLRCVYTLSGLKAWKISSPSGSAISKHWHSTLRNYDPCKRVPNINRTYCQYMLYIVISKLVFVSLEILLGISPYIYWYISIDDVHFRTSFDFISKKKNMIHLQLTRPSFYQTLDAISWLMRSGINIWKLTLFGRTFWPKYNTRFGHLIVMYGFTPYLGIRLSYKKYHNKRVPTLKTTHQNYM